jgi:hypothetical protein
MSIGIIITLAALGITATAATIWAVLTAREGVEDKEGFHFVDEPRRTSRGAVHSKSPRAEMSVPGPGGREAPETRWSCLGAERRRATYAASRCSPWVRFSTYYLWGRR